MTEVERLTKRQADAREAAKKATAELDKARRKAKAKAKKAAEKAEQAEALAFYREYRDFIEWMQRDATWTIEAKDGGGKMRVTRYEFCIQQMKGK